MARLGFIMLAHTALNRAGQVARYWAEHGCPVVIHVDAAVGPAQFDALVAQLSDLDNVLFSGRERCEWGTFSIVRATQTAAELLLETFAEVTHVYLASGSCLPLRPPGELADYLDRHPRTDFIESVTTEEVAWTVGGLDLERFTLRFPFSWKRHRKLFDAYVSLQRRIGYARRIPEGLDPHLGSQWWCLTRQTLSAILADPRRAEYDRYFAKVWIPDESYFQTLARIYAQNIESRSLTLSKFDYQGKPYVFYDDHLALLQRSDCFVARKIWPRADQLYARFLSDPAPGTLRPEPNPRKLDRLFARATALRTRGRAGLYSQSRFPGSWHDDIAPTCAPYSVFHGFDDLFENFEAWLEKRTGARVHGHLFARAGAQFAQRGEVFEGCLPASAKLRDYNPRAFLSNLIWNTQGEYQCFLHGPGDSRRALEVLPRDPNARLYVITGAWAVPLYHSNLNFARIRKIAARYQRAEVEMLELLNDKATRCQLKLWSLAEFIEQPMAILQEIVNAHAQGQPRRLSEVPRMRAVEGLGKFVQNLRNQGMNPHMVGDLPIDLPEAPRPAAAGRPYLVGE
ncbi:MAG: glycosyl transferase [Alphaproteobacteria bacterium]|nr:MAG: glycosyl transferase [Alphaproteobacteria bacterium]